MKKLAIVIASTLGVCGLIACGLFAASFLRADTTAVLPTTAATAAPVVRPTFTHSGPYQDIRDLVNGVLGDAQGDGKTTIYPYVDSDRVTYDIDVAIADPARHSRADMLQLAHNLSYEFYYNFADTRPMAIWIHLRGSQGNSDCVFGLGIGYEAAAKFIPAQRTTNLETWYRALVDSRYYGDDPGQDAALTAYGNDPNSKPLCSLEGWKR